MRFSSVNDEARRHLVALRTPRMKDSVTVSRNTVVRRGSLDTPSEKRFNTLALYGHEIARYFTYTGALEVSFAGWPTRTTLARLHALDFRFGLTRVGGASMPTFWGVPFPATAWLRRDYTSNTQELIGEDTVKVCSRLYAHWLMDRPQGEFKRLLTVMYAGVARGESYDADGLLSTQEKFQLVLIEAQRRGKAMRRCGNPHPVYTF